MYNIHTMSERIESMTYDEKLVNIIYNCLLFDGFNTPKSSIAEFLKGYSVMLTIKEVQHILAYKKVTEVHILNKQGYSVSIALIQAFKDIYNMYLDSNISINYSLGDIHDSTDLCKVLHKSDLTANPVDASAKIFRIIYYNRLLESKSQSIAYLLALYYLQQRNYTIILPTEQQINTILRYGLNTREDLLVDLFYGMFY